MTPTLWDHPFSPYAQKVKIALRDKGLVFDLVVGCGPAGLAVIAALKARRLGPVIASDYSPARRRLAEQFGADEVIDPAADDPHARWACRTAAPIDVAPAVTGEVGLDGVADAFAALGDPDRGTIVVRPNSNLRSAPDVIRG